MTKEKLASFVKALKINGILDFKVDLFNNRLKLQKLVYIAKEWGYDIPYNYSLYIRGPYSSSLADDYYHLDNLIEGVDPMVLYKDFISLTKNKSENCLELTATIMMINNRYNNITKEEIISIVKNNKPWATEEKIGTLMDELINRNIIT